MEKEEAIKLMLQANEFCEFERNVLSYVKNNNTGVPVLYSTLLNLFPGNATQELLKLMAKKPYFQTQPEYPVSLDSNPFFIGLTPEGEGRLQELLTKEKDK